MKSTQKRVVGRPFPPGKSGNPGGRPRDPLLEALRQKLTPERAEKIAEALLVKMENGDIPALTTGWERVAGKVPNKNENGEPGDFDMDLSEEDRSQIRSALRVVRGRSAGS